MPQQNQRSNSITSPAPSYQDMVKRMAEMEAELARVKASASAPKSITLKASSKGAISIYGVYARFPISLYSASIRRLHDAGVLLIGPALQAFIDANADKLSTGKDDARFQQPDGV